MQLDESIGVENRTSYRYPFNRSVSYEVSMGPSPTDTEGSPTHPGIAINVSSGGLCLLTHQKLQEQQVIKVGLPLPNVDTTVNVLAEVKWRKNMGPRGNIVGLSFFM